MQRAAKQHSTPPHRAFPGRSGSATVELAICLPLILLITLGAIEAANSIYLKQIMTQAAYEGGRVVSSPGGTEAAACARAQEILDARRIDATSIQIQPTVTALTPSGTEIVISVSAPSNSNAISPLWFFQDTEVSARIVMVRN